MAHSAGLQDTEHHPKLLGQGQLELVETHHAARAEEVVDGVEPPAYVDKEAEESMETGLKELEIMRERVK